MCYYSDQDGLQDLVIFSVCQESGRLVLHIKDLYLYQGFVFARDFSFIKDSEPDFTDTERAI